MFSGIRKAAVAIQNSTSGTGCELRMSILEEKNVVEALYKLISAKRKANVEWEKFAEQENDIPIREMIFRINDLDQILLRCLGEYLETYENFSQLLKPILKSEKALEESRKQADAQSQKASKLQKQWTVQCAKSPVEKKMEVLQIEVGTALSVESSLMAQLKTQEANHNIFKYLKVREAYKMLLDSQVRLDRRSLQIAEAKQAIANMFLDDSDKISTNQEALETAQWTSMKIVNDLAKNCGFPSIVIPADGVHATVSTKPGEVGGHEMEHEEIYIEIPEKEPKNQLQTKDDITTSGTILPIYENLQPTQLNGQSSPTQTFSGTSQSQSTIATSQNESNEFQTDASLSRILCERRKKHVPGTTFSRATAPSLDEIYSVEIKDLEIRDPMPNDQRRSEPNISERWNLSDSAQRTLEEEPIHGTLSSLQLAELRRNVDTSSLAVNQTLRPGECPQPTQLTTGYQSKAGPSTSKNCDRPPPLKPRKPIIWPRAV